MPEEIEKVRHLIEEHSIVKDRLRLIGDEINDLEAMKNLQTMRDSVSGTEEVVLGEKLKELKQNVSYISEGLRKHFEDEEKLLPELIGELLTKALLHEHRKIKEDIAALADLSNNATLEEISQQRSPAIMMYIAQIINSLRNKIEEHSSREDAVFQLALVGLQERR
jgi:hemerythrin